MNRVPVLLLLLLLTACAGDDDNSRSPLADSSSPVAPPVVDIDTEPVSRRTRFRDEETGSVWDLTGLAIDGPLVGTQLQQLPAYSAYWFAWSSFWPNTDVWGEQDGTGEFAPSAFQPIESGFIPDVPVDAIPPLDAPSAGFGQALFLGATESSLAADDIVIGVQINGDARAYPVQILNFHEIVNHRVGGRELVVTYCPLTASGVVFDGGDAFGNTGGLFNNNMVMYDRATRSGWSQMGLAAILGDRGGQRLSLLPVFQGTWSAWRELFPHTRVLSADTGYNRDYSRDIYISSGYTESSQIWFPQNPSIDRRFHAKRMTLGLIGAQGTRAYLFEHLATLGDRVVINDDFEGRPVVVVYDGPARMAVPYSRTISQRTLTFSVLR
jgi:hypothetical protein